MPVFLLIYLSKITPFWNMANISISRLTSKNGDITFLLMTQSLEKLGLVPSKEHSITIHTYVCMYECVFNINVCMYIFREYVSVFEATKTGSDMAHLHTIFSALFDNLYFNNEAKNSKVMPQWILCFQCFFQIKMSTVVWVSVKRWDLSNILLRLAVYIHFFCQSKCLTQSEAKVLCKSAIRCRLNAPIKFWACSGLQNIIVK